MKRQESEIKKIRQLLSDAESMWKDLPRKADLQLSSNQTLDAIAKAVEDIKETEENGKQYFVTFNKSVINIDNNLKDVYIFLLLKYSRHVSDPLIG